MTVFKHGRTFRYDFGGIGIASRATRNSIASKDPLITKTSNGRSASTWASRNGKLSVERHN